MPDENLPADITADITKVEPKTTFYKGEDQVSMTPEEAKKFQGGSLEDPFSGLKASGWSTEKIAKPVIKPKTVESAVKPTTPTTEEITTEPTKIEKAASAAEQAIIDQASFYESQYNKLQTEFDNYTKDIAEIDAENNPLIQSIKDTFNRRITEMQGINKSMQGQISLAGTRTGLARYASQMQQGLISQEVTSGMNRISELERQKLTAIEEAKRALKSDAKDKWKTFNEFMDSASEAYANKVQAVKDLHTFLKDEEDRAYNQNIKDIQIQQLEQEMVQSNLDMYSSAMLSYDEAGNLTMPTADELQTIADDLGVNVNILAGSIRNKYVEMSKLNQEDQLRELNIMKAIADLEDRNKTELIKNYDFAVKQGYSGDILQFKKDYAETSNQNKSIEGLDDYKRNILVARLGKQIYGTRISDKEGERVDGFITEGMKRGKTQMEIIDDVLGYQIDDNANKNLAEALRNVLLQNAGESGLAGFDMLGLARLINQGKDTEAIRKAELSVLNNARTIDPDGFVGEGTVRTAIEKSNNLIGFIEALDESPIGVVEGSFTKWIKRKFRGEEEQEIMSKVTDIVAKMRNELLGSAVTETEQKFLEPLIPDLNDTPDNFMKKVETLKSRGLIELNNYRNTFGLPKLDEVSLLNPDLKKELYTGEFSPVRVNQNFETFYNETVDKDAVDKMLYDNNLGSTIEERKANIMQFYNSDFNSPLSMGQNYSEILEKVVSVSDGVKGGQCGRFVNKYTGLGLGDSYQSKLAKMDPTIKTPEPGMVFVMPYSWTGHTGFIIGVNNDGTVTVKDSNYGFDETVKTRIMPISKITGLTRV